MHKLASPFTTYLCRRKVGNVPSRKFLTSQIRKEEEAMEEEAENKIGWFLKLLFAGTATVIAYQFFPYLGENLLQQYVSLLHVKDPLFKRMGASRLSHFAIDDDMRKKIIDLCGAAELLNMLGDAKDDPTLKEALKALAALSPSVNDIEYDAANQVEECYIALGRNWMQGCITGCYIQCFADKCVRSVIPTEATRGYTNGFPNKLGNMPLSRLSRLGSRSRHTKSVENLLEGVNMFDAASIADHSKLKSSSLVVVKQEKIAAK